MRLIIKVDENNKDILKAYYRMSALADVLKEICEVIFICNKTDVNGIVYLFKKRYKVHGYDGPDLQNVVNKYKGESIIIDTHQKLSVFDDLCIKNFNKVIYVDDKGTKAFKGDMIISPVYEGNTINYLVPKSCKIIGGKDALLIRDEVRAIQKIPIAAEVKNILIALGETSKNLVTRELLERIKYIDCSFKVVLTKKLKERELITIKLKAYNIEFYEEEDLLEVASQCDMAVSGFNYYIYELLAIGMPTIGIVLERTEINGGICLLKEELIKGIGVVGLVKVSEIIKEINNLKSDYKGRLKLQENTRNKINPRSNILVADNVLNLLRS
ncbi:MAG: hypothetical protein BEN19_07175 [Epulopiscium sp. Nuni2H_MBin003]|nr:MAG: hypothetical protein BEN19_07175 [Epulopiscium sp. Nuni2H_MBin003]